MGSIRLTGEPAQISEDGLEVLIYKGVITWSRWASIRLLQGATIPTLFNGKYVLVGGTHRASFHPIPGVDAVTLAEVVLNPTALPSFEIQSKLYGKKL